jgi:hypothetical protein
VSLVSRRHRRLRAAGAVARAKGTDLSLWVIYDHPRDFPDAFVARRHTVGADGQKATQDKHEAQTLDALRALLPPGLVSIGRMAGDDPCIVEVWL